eukprot:TRINITY_DN14523_c0_g1_i1.p1 TRINITY_DN14523_c0_g1~~TRINITY_DN14523_c0_g1_i1.p1  ORF type:complete len:233 (+),score=28.14 TRINITY_DN14523_c0_g1_i1:39-701(+)
MAAAAATFGVVVQFRPIILRKAYYLNIAICFIAAVAYFAMASNDTKDAKENEGRQVIYARYIDWVLTTPLLLLDLILMTNMPAKMISWIIVGDVAMVLFGIIGAFTGGDYRWGYFAAGCIMQLCITWGMLNPLFRDTLKKSKEYSESYTWLLIYLVIVWVFYPVVWGFGAGGRLLDVDGEIIAMGVLDVLAKPLFAVGVLVAHETIYKKFQGSLEQPLTA